MIKSMHWSLLLAALSAASASACADVEETEVGDAAEASAALSSAQPVYLRSNATTWDLNATNRLTQPDGYFYDLGLEYQVTQSWMLTSGDELSLLQTNSESGWGSEQSYYSAVFAGIGRTSALSAPAPSQQTFRVTYPFLGKYRLLLRPSADTLSIAPAITPIQNQGVIGTRVTFSTGAQGSDLSYRWEVRTMSNNQWTQIAGEAGPSLSVEVKPSGMVCPRYRAGITTAAGETFYTHDALLVDQLPPPVITQDLPEAVEVLEGDRLTLSLLTTTGAGFTYWYVNNGPRQGGSGIYTTQPLTLADDGMTIRAEAVAYAGNHQCTAHGIAPSKVTTVRVVQR